MIKNIIKDTKRLMLVSSSATKEDAHIIQDLKDTISFHRSHCVGMAANMIGYLKRILIYEDNQKYYIMINPTILKQEGEYRIKEGCLSLEGVREVKRYQKIKVEYLNEDFQKRIKTFQGFPAEIIQHEIDHFNGILV